MHTIRVPVVLTGITCPYAEVKILKLHTPKYYECSRLEPGSCRPETTPTK